MNINRGIIMDLLSKELYNEYLREEKLLGDTSQYNNMQITPVDVLKAHYIITDYFADTDNGKVLSGIKNIDLLLSAVARQSTNFGGKEKWKTPLEKCASLFYGLNKNHAFNDGNKRTSLLITLHYLYLINRMPTGNQKKFETLTVRIAANELYKYPISKRYKDDPDAPILIIANELRHLTRKTDNRFYALTYREFGQKLEQLGMGYYFGQPNNGYISVYQERKTFLGPKKRHVRQIGFPGWSRQIGAKAAKSILHDLNLDDYYQFFKDGEPIYKLLEDYSGPLSRLKDK